METNEKPTIEKRRISEKRKEKSRDAARYRRSRESEIIIDLAGVLPLPKSVVSHLDKASVMRLVIANLRIISMFQSMGIEEKSLKTDVCDQFYLQAIGGIVLVVSVDGEIIYVSNNVSTYLGVSQVDLLGQSFFDMIHPFDHKEMKDLLSAKIKSDNGQISVFVRIKCSQNSKGRTVNLKTASYKVLHIVGRFLKIDESPNERFGFATIATPIPHPAYIETPIGSYTFLSKHSLDMKFTFADERMTDFLGYNPDNLIGESMYNFHHVEDNREIIKSFKSLFEKGQSETCHYRFMAQGGGYIWVCTQATVLFCDKKNLPLSVVCLNYVVSGKHNEVEIYSREQLEWCTIIDTELDKSSKLEIQTKNTSDNTTRRLTAKIRPCTPNIVTTHIMASQENNDVNESISKTEEMHSPRPRPATSEIFGPRTADMNKGFLMFPDDESGVTVLKEEPEDLTHLAPTAGDVCVPLSIPPFLDGMMDLFSDKYSPLINQDKETPLFSSYDHDNSSRSLSPALNQNGLSGTTLCSLSDDGNSTVEEATMKSLLGLDFIVNENEHDKTGFTDLHGIPLLNTSDLLWDVSPLLSPSTNSYSLEVGIKSDSMIGEFSNFEPIMQEDSGSITKKDSDHGAINSYLISGQQALLDSENRKRICTMQEETVKKRKPCSASSDRSVLMNLLIEGRDLTNGYTCFDSRTINGNSKSCLPSIKP